MRAYFAFVTTKGRLRRVGGKSVIDIIGIIIIIDSAQALIGVSINLSI